MLKQKHIFDVFIFQTPVEVEDVPRLQLVGASADAAPAAGPGRIS